MVAGVLSEIIEKVLDWINNDTWECVWDHIAKNYAPNAIYTSIGQLERILRAASLGRECGWTSRVRRRMAVKFCL